jgi:hypothetical protein
MVDGILATNGYCDITLTSDGSTVKSYTARSKPNIPVENCGAICTLPAVMEDATLSNHVWGYSNGSVKQYINPPLRAGEDVVSFERFNNEFVYVKVFDLGTLPNSTTKSYTIPSGITNVLDFRVIAYKSANAVYNFFPWVSDSGTAIGKCGLNASPASGSPNFYIKTFSDLSAHKAYAILKYTKSGSSVCA